MKDNKIVLEGNRNYSDGLCDIPMYKQKISPLNYPKLTIHPGLYPTKMQTVNSVVKAKQSPVKMKFQSYQENFGNLKP